MFRFIWLAIALPFSWSKGFICHQILQDHLFKLGDLTNRKSDFKQPVVIEGEEFELHFNFCKTLQTPCQAKYAYAALFKKNDPSVCHKFDQNSISNLFSSY